MSMVSEWKRVRVRRWTKGSSVTMRMLRRVPGRPPEKEKEHFQLFDNLIGVTVPVKSKYGVVVLPLTFLSNGREWVKMNPEVYLYIVPEQHLEILGDAYDEEILKIRRALRAHGMPDVKTPDTLLMQRVRDRMERGLDSFEQETLEADREKAARARRRRGVPRR